LGATYLVEVFFENGCVYSAPMTFESGLEEVNLKNVQVFPNPTEGFININAEDIIESIEIIDFKGKVLLTKEVKHLTYKLDVSYISGIYFMKINFGNQSEYVRVKIN